MKIARLLLALFALFPVTVFVSAQPAMAQANCRWDLDGLWVGQRNGWRVNQKMRPEGFIVWADGVPEPGQNENVFLYKQTGPKTWTHTWPDGTKATATLDANGLLQTVQPSGRETFKRVRPAGPPKCVPLAASTPAATQGKQGTGAQKINANPALAAPARIVTRVTLEDIKAIAVAEGATITFAEDRGSTVLVFANLPNGLEVGMMGQNCQSGPPKGCSTLSFILSYPAPPGFSANKVNQIALYDGPRVVLNETKNHVGSISHVPLFDGLSMKYLRSYFNSMKSTDQLMKARIYEQSPPDNTGGS